MANNDLVISCKLPIIRQAFSYKVNILTKLLILFFSVLAYFIHCMCKCLTILAIDHARI